VPKFTDHASSPFDMEILESVFGINRGYNNSGCDSSSGTALPTMRPGGQRNTTTTVDFLFKEDDIDLIEEEESDG